MGASAELNASSSTKPPTLDVVIATAVAELTAARHDWLDAKMHLRQPHLTPTEKARWIGSHDAAARRVTRATKQLMDAIDAARDP